MLNLDRWSAIALADALFDMYGPNALEIAYGPNSRPIDRLTESQPDPDFLVFPAGSISFSYTKEGDAK